MRLGETCDQCGAKKILWKEQVYIKTFFPEEILATVKTYKCWHSEYTERPTKLKVDFANLTLSKQAYDFQEIGVKFIVDSDFNCLIADAMGLGKTIQAVLAARAFKKTHKGPILVVGKATTTYQWIREIHDWLNNSQLSTFPIIGTQGFIPPGFDVYYISMDTLGRNGTWKKLLMMGFKLVIVDESHSFKEIDAKRTQALISLLKVGKIKHKVFLSGTPIKNRATEYFTVLNLLAPDVFPSEARFKRDWLEAEYNGKGYTYKRLNRYRIEQFRELTSRWVLRREKHEVLKDLPKFTRTFNFVDIEDPNIKNSYNKQLDLMTNLMEQGELKDNFSILGELAKLRHIIGRAKVSLCAEQVNEFLESTEQEFKLSIGVHHQDVRDALFYSLQSYNPLKISGEENAWQKDKNVQEFNKPDRRLMILQIMAGGIGLNLQMCANTLILEREWNSADEEQFESRFHRNGQTIPVVADYLMARGTLDEWFHDMVETKRIIFGETVTSWQFTNDSQSIRELFDKSISNRL